MRIDKSYNISVRKLKNYKIVKGVRVKTAKSRARPSFLLIIVLNEQFKNYFTRFEFKIKVLPPRKV